MPRILRLASPWLVVAAFFSLWAVDASGAPHLDLRSAILLDTTDGQVLYEQNADLPIPPASVTKILTLYLIFDAIKQGQVHPSDRVPVSKRAANTGGSRMGLRAGKDVPLEELIKGIAVVSGNDGAVAAAEYLSGNVESFVMKMNVKARELGMTNSEFMTPNGLPAKGQVTTARDLAKLSSSYIRHYPEALHIHSMTSYTYCCATHHNANRLLGVCPGVDGIKTGFVCASGFNLAATAKRGDVRLIAVALGARSPWIRTMETEKLLEAGFQKLASDVKDPGSVEEILARQDATRNARNVRMAGAVPTGERQGSHANRKRLKGHASPGKAADTSRTCPPVAKCPKLVKKAAPAEDSCPVGEQAKAKTAASKGKLQLVKQTGAVKGAEATAKPATAEGRTAVKKQTAVKEAAGSKKVDAPPKPSEQEQSAAVQVASKPTPGTKQKSASGSSKKTD
jgi:D-alanyl-D-alanine carboxypeptidase